MKKLIIGTLLAVAIIGAYYFTLGSSDDAESFSADENSNLSKQETVSQTLENNISETSGQQDSEIASDSSVQQAQTRSLEHTRRTSPDREAHRIPPPPPEADGRHKQKNKIIAPVSRLPEDEN